jgi:4-amino-4-deoxy-L-arabinose transferase-like glycosyltransferase
MHAVRFALAWGGAVLIVFSLFKTKLIYYLLPTTPAFALLAAAGLAVLKTAPRRIETAAMAILLLLLAIALLAAPQVPRLDHLVSAEEWPLFWLSAIALAATAVVLFVWPPGDRVATVGLIGSASVVMVLGLYAGVVRAVIDNYNVAPIAYELARVQTAGQVIAHHGKYHGQYQFVGRLVRPLEVVPRADELLAWAKQHPDGSVVIYSYRPLTHPSARPQAMQKFKGRYASVWRGADLAAVSDGWSRPRPDDEADSQ